MDLDLAAEFLASSSTLLPRCRCGSSTHVDSRSHDCPLRAGQQAKQQAKQHAKQHAKRACRCGSTAHSRSSHSDCPLNPDNKVSVGKASTVHKASKARVVAAASEASKAHRVSRPLPVKQPRFPRAGKWGVL